MGGDQVLSVTKLVNWLLGKPAAALLALLHIHPANPEYPIPNHIAMELVILAGSAAFVLWLKRRLSVDRPQATQQCVEMLLSNPMGLGIQDLLDDNLGHQGKKYLYMVGALGMFVFLGNLIGVVPGLASPTAQYSVPFACAIVVFAYYNWKGLRHHGLWGYAKTFAGPIPALAPVMPIIEFPSHLARVISLTIRLYANIFVGELLYGIFLSLTVALFAFLSRMSPAGYLAGISPILIPLPFMLLHVFEALIQAFVFTILPIVYISGAISEEH